MSVRSESLMIKPGVTRHCVAIDAMGCILQGMFRSPMFTNEAGDSMTPREVVTECAEAIAAGYVVVPPCDNHDDRGYCQGHPIVGCEEWGDES